MKNIIFLAFVLLFGFNAFAQEQIISKNVSLTISEKLTSLSKDQENHIRRNQFKGFAFGNLIDKKTYSKNNLLLEIYEPTTKEKNIITLTKEMDDKMYSAAKTLHYLSSIEIIRSNTVLVSQMESNHKNLYSFLIQNQTKIKLLSGVIFYHDGDEKKAKALLYKILNGVKFKD